MCGAGVEASPARSTTPINTMSKKTTIVEGPHGYKMPESLALRIEAVAKSAGVKADDYRRRASTGADFKLEDGSRTEVSTVTTDALDRDREVVMPSGLDLTDFRSNPVVCFSHRHDELPVGKCTWIKSSADGRALVAKTQYASRPKDWTGEWLPDAIFSLIQEEMLPGKSIGFIPTAVRMPTKDEIAERPELKNCSAVISKGTLLEYSVTGIPANQEAIALAVSKRFSGDTLKHLVGEAIESVEAAPVVPEIKSFVAPETILRAIAAKRAAVREAVRAKLRECVIDEIHRLKGTP